MTEDRATGLRRVLADVAGFAGSQYFLRFANILKAFLVARILGPAGNGLWQHFVIITEYADFSHLGALQGLNKVLGHRIGRKDEPGTTAAQETGTGGVVASAAVLAVGLCAYVGVRWDSLPVWDRWGLPLVGTIAISKQAAFVYWTLLRARSRIGLISGTEIVFAITNLALSVGLLFVWGVAGLLVGWLVSRAATTVWLVHKSGFPFRPRLVTAELKVLLATGFPIYLFHLTRVGLRNIDRVLVDSVLDKTDLGIYGLAVTLAGLVRYGADAVGFVIYPIFLRSYGETGDPRASWEQLAKPTELLSLVVPIALGFAWLVLHLPIRWLLPQFEASIPIYRLLTITIAFQCLAILPGFYLMAIDRQNWLIPLGITAIAFDFFVGRHTIAMGWGLSGVALTMGLGSILYCTVVLAYACSFAIGSAARTAAWISRVYLPVIFFAGLVALIRWIVPRTALADAGELLRAGVEGALFLAFSAPLLLAFEKRHGVIHRLRRRDAPREDDS